MTARKQLLPGLDRLTASLIIGLLLGASGAGMFANVSKCYLLDEVSPFQSPTLTMPTLITSSAATSKASQSQSDTQQEHELDKILSIIKVTGGHCPATECQIGGTKPREAFHQAPNATAYVQAIDGNKFVPVKLKVDKMSSIIQYQMFIRNPRKDQFISASIAKGQEHDPPVRRVVEAALRYKKDPIFIDIGSNIGYFTATALAMGARTISFEPFMDNAASLMSTIEKNPGWKDRATLYMNAATYEASHVNMKSMNSDINLSNMHIKASACADSEGSDTSGTYGIDYMEGVPLDQVWLTHHADIKHVDLMKIDVERYEMEVLNGAMHLLCNAVVDQIVIEVLYLRAQFGVLPCTFATMQTQLEKMGYEIWDLPRTKNFTGKFLDTMTGDVLFVLKDTSVSPAQRFRGTTDNPCQRFDLERA
jgi:FkbM family methyltransferase